jgi:hypothetical protein
MIKLFTLPKTCLFLFIGLMASRQTHAQSFDLGNLKNAKKLTITGGLNFNNLYNSFVPVATQNNSYFINGSINFNVMGLINIPLNLNYSSRKFNYSQPFSFNQFSIAPRYKWVTGYFGTSTMTFSPYTLNGHQFNGVGFEFMPNKWQISTMAGRLIKQNNDSTYNRMGYGLKVLYNPGNYRIGFNFLHAADNPNSIQASILERNSVRPSKNVVLGLEGGINIAKIAQLDLEFSNSLIGENINFINLEKQTGIASVFFANNGPIRSLTAIKAKLSKALFKGKTIVGLGYERVDPGYKTFGGYFFTDDLISYTVNLSQRFWENKISISANLGSQRDILETKSNGQSRLVVAANVNIIPSEKLNINLSYSTFKGYSYIRDLVKESSRISNLVPIDTLNFTQINRNTSVNVSYNLVQNEKQSQSVSLNGTIMDAANKQGQIIRQGQASQVYSSQLSYNIGWLKKKLNASLGYSYNINAIGLNNIKLYGPTLNVQRSFFKDKLSASLSANSLKSINTSALNPSSSSVFNTNLNLNYGLSKKSKLLFSLLLLNNQDSSNPIGTSDAFTLPSTIYTINFGYKFNF